MAGFCDISVALAPGVFVLYRGERAIYVAWARVPISAIEAHRGFNAMMAESFAGGLRFDRAEIFPCGPDRAKPLVASLRQFHALDANGPIPPAPASRAPRLSLKPTAAPP